MILDRLKELKQEITFLRNTFLDSVDEIEWGRLYHVEIWDNQLKRWSDDLVDLPMRFSESKFDDNLIMAADESDRPSVCFRRDAYGQKNYHGWRVGTCS